MDAVRDFIITSETKGLPVLLMEAHACGIPAIAIIVGSIPESVLTELETLKVNGRLNWYTRYNASRSDAQFTKTFKPYR